MNTPKIVDVKVDWLMEYGNRPRLTVYVDRIISPDEFVFEKSGRYYKATVGPAVNIYAYESAGNGFGGSPFHLLMKDGSTEILKGPWSGNYAGCNAKFKDDLIVGATVYNKNQVSCLSWHVRLKDLVDFIDEHPKLPFRMAKLSGNKWHDEFPFEPVHAETLLPKADENRNIIVEVLTNK